MRFRKLRIAWSVGCGIACVLLIVSWLASYSRGFGLYGNWKNHAFVFESMKGEFYFAYFNPDQPEPDSLNIAYAPLSPLQRILQARTCWLRWQKASPPSNAITLWIRHWLVLLLSLNALGTPWIRWRFSLRTLLIATTLVAMVLGAIVYAAGKAS
jgi:hypothetical protein